MAKTRAVNAEDRMTNIGFFITRGNTVIIDDPFKRDNTDAKEGGQTAKWIVAKGTGTLVLEMPDEKPMEFAVLAYQLYGIACTRVLTSATINGITVNTDVVDPIFWYGGD